MPVTTSRAPQSSFFSSLVKVQSKDQEHNRFQDSVAATIQPVLSIFEGSPGAATISWGMGTPVSKKPPGSVYFRIDVGTTSATQINSLYIKQTPTTSPVWATFAVGNATGQATALAPGISSPSRTIILACYDGINGTNAIRPVTNGSNAFVQNSGGAAVAVMPFSGSIVGIMITKQKSTGGGVFPPATGSLTCTLYKNNVATGATVTLTSGGTGAVYATFTQGSIPFVPGDILELWASSASLTVSDSIPLYSYQVWGVTN